MGKGQDKIAISLMDLQPTAIIEFFLLYFNTIDREDSFLAFHGGSNFSRGVTWQGINYLPVPVETEGFEINANGQMPRPKIRISNKDYFITDMLIRNSDFQYSKIIRKRTFIKYLDDVNFDGGNPWGEADSTAEISNESYIISQKTAENKNFVEFELTSPLDLENFELNNRLILSRYCSWMYRGNGCNYKGIPIETEEGVSIPYTVPANAVDQSFLWSQGTFYKVGDGVYLENKRIFVENQLMTMPEPVKVWFVCKIEHVASDATRPDSNVSYWMKDGCSKKLSSCKKRFPGTSYILEKVADKITSNQYIDFSFKSSNPTNNVIYNFADITASEIYNQPGSSPTQGNELKSPSNVADHNFNTSWIGGTNDAGGIIYFNNLPSSSINRINLYDLPSLTDNFTLATFDISGASTDHPTLSVANDGSMSYLTNLIYQNITGVKIASTAAGIGRRGLTEVDLISNDTAYGLYNTTFTSSKIHQNSGFLIGMWGNFPNGVSNSIAFNLFHNVKNGCQYSGINLYLSGGKVICDFAVTSIQDDVNTALGTVGPILITNKSIEGDYPELFNKENFCLFFENYQFQGSSTGELFSRIRIYDANKNTIAQYSPALKDVANRYSGESFLFKDPVKQNGISYLYFGINQWQEHERGIVYTSPLLLGSTAIWSSALIEGDVRQTIFTSNKNESDNNKIFPVNYSELDANSIMKKDLHAWWDMDIITPTPPNTNYSITNSHTTAANALILNGLYKTSLEKVINTSVPSYQFINKGSPIFGLPFGGFPATDRYGR